jgi:hypothetical protein
MFFETTEPVIAGPKPGEKWTIGAYTGLTFIDVGRTIHGQKVLIFADPVDRYFIISKDEFYDKALFKKKEVGT